MKSIIKILDNKNEIIGLIQSLHFNKNLSSGIMGRVKFKNLPLETENYKIEIENEDNLNNLDFIAKIKNSSSIWSLPKQNSDFFQLWEIVSFDVKEGIDKIKQFINFKGLNAAN